MRRRRRFAALPSRSAGARRAMIAVAGVALLLTMAALPGPVAVAQETVFEADDAPQTRPDGDGGTATQTRPVFDESVRPAVAVAEAFRDAYAARDADAVWAHLTPASQDRLAGVLTRLKAAARNLPRDERNAPVSGLGVTARELLEFDGGLALLKAMMSQVSARNLGLVGDCRVASAEAADDGSYVVVGWESDDSGMPRSILRAMPVRIERTGDGGDTAWKVVISER
jgi:hypothetical protein